MNWITDNNGNRCSVEYWGSEAEARKALESLENCRNTDNCSGCSGCSGCYGCYGCYDCYDCSGCSGCYGCYGCYDCYDCSGCSGCSDCSDMAPTKVESPAIPRIENIHQAIYAAVSAKPDALNMATWHTCETTHCRAGWVVHLAGEAGYALEKRTSAEFAAMQIYKASGYEISPVRFYDKNEAALEDMRKLAEQEKANAI